MKDITTKLEVKERMAEKRIVKDYKYCVFSCPYSKEMNGKTVCMVDLCPKNNVAYEFRED